MYSVVKCPYFLSSLCVQGLFQTFIGCNYCIQSSALRLEKKCFSSEIDENNIYLGGASAQKALCSENLSEKHTHVPNVQNRPRFNIFWFLILIPYIISIGQYQALFITQEQLGNFYSETNFKCQMSTAAVIVCEYLFTLVKTKDDQSLLKNCKVKHTFQPGFFASFILAIMGQHGKVYF